MLRASDCAAAANLLLRYRIPYRGLRKEDDGAVFIMRSSDHRRYRELLDSVGAVSVCEKGLPRLVRLYRKRIGLPLGAVLFCIMLFFSSRFIWDMDISGNSELTDDEITELLLSQGCGIGAYVPGLDLYSVCCRCMLECDRIAWISVNLEGTVAHVEIMEREPKPTGPDTCPSNIVAACDGVICYYNVYSGTCAVEVGQQVKKGDLLISGISGEESEDTSFVHSDAAVYAYTVHTLSVKVPYEYEERRPCGDPKIYRTANIFGKSIKLYLNSGNLPGVCDTINYEKISLEKSRYRLVIFGDTKLPVVIDETSVRDTETYTVRLGDEEALKKAKEQLGELAAEELGRADVLSRSEVAEIYGEGGGKYLVYSVEYRCMEDIAKNVIIGAG